ncbi:MAG TPA: hypothetical protein VK196_16365, partial [Magnetospirillum sp.]|nr:hypothetical protein [Magnetospirillum sp.]
MILARRHTSSNWLALGAVPADELGNSPLWSRRDDQPLVVGRWGDASVLYPAPTPAPAARRLIQAIRRRRPRGIVAVCDMQAIEAGLSPPSSALASALAEALPDLPVGIILVDRRLGTMPAAVGGAGASPELVTAWIEETLAAQTVAHIDEHGLAPDGDPAAIFRPGQAAEHRASWLAAIDNALAALPTGRFAGLHVVGQCDHPVSDTLPASLASLAAANPPPRRHPWPPAVAALCLLIPAGLAIGAWWSVGDIARTALRQKTIIAQAASADGISPLAMATLGDMVAGIRTGRGRMALVPSSWLNGLEKIHADQVRAAIGPTMLQPVRKHLEARYEELAATVAELEGGTDTSPQTSVATAGEILRRAAAFDQQARRFQLLAEGNVHDQWHPLLAAAAGTEAAPAAAWLADEAGAALFIRALTEFGWQPPKTEPLVHRVVAALGQASTT